jgi:ankyrin repeat protein
MDFQSDFPGVMRVLLDAKTDILSPYKGYTPLMYAVLRSNTEAVDILLAAGANPNDIMPTGASVLMSACANDNIAIVSSLIHAGADVNAVSDDAASALDEALAASNPEIATVIAEAGGKTWLNLMGEKYELVRAVDDEELDLELVDKLMIDAGEEEKEVAIFVSILDNRVVLVKRFLAAGVSTEIRNSGNTMLLVASALGLVDIVTELLDAGADITAKDAHGRTPVQRAAMRKHRDVVKLLLNKTKELKNANK